MENAYHINYHFLGDELFITSYAGVPASTGMSKIIFLFCFFMHQSLMLFTSRFEIMDIMLLKHEIQKLNYNILLLLNMSDE